MIISTVDGHRVVIPNTVLFINPVIVGYPSPVNEAPKPLESVPR